MAPTETARATTWNALRALTNEPSESSWVRARDAVQADMEITLTVEFVRWSEEHNDLLLGIAPTTNQQFDVQELDTIEHMAMAIRSVFPNIGAEASMDLANNLMDNAPYKAKEVIFSIGRLKRILPTENLVYLFCKKCFVSEEWT